MVLTDGFRSIEFNDVNNNKGLSLDIENFDLDLLNGVIKYDKMKFGGITNVSAKVMDVFSQEKEISGYVNIPNFTINEDKYGSVFIDLTKNYKAPYKANISIGDFLAVNGSFDPDTKVIDSRIKLREAPMEIIEYLLKDGIKDTKGFIKADITFGGKNK
jgi:hypothetical protein